MHCRTHVFKKAVFCFIIVFLMVLSGSANAVEDSIHVAMPVGPKSLNYFDATDAWSRKVLRFFHMPRYIRGPVDGKMIPWLAESLPTMTGSPVTATLRLRETKWDDGSPTTVEDLIFTIRVIQEFSVPGHKEKWQDVVRMDALDQKTIRFTLKGAAHRTFSRSTPGTTASIDGI